VPMAKRSKRPTEPRNEAEAFDQYSAATAEEHDAQRRLDEWRAQNPKGGAPGLEDLVAYAKEKRRKAAEALEQFRSTRPRSRPH